MAWQIKVTIAAHTWTITQVEPGTEVPDDVAVLDDMRFGWLMPKGIWPAQPDAASATFSLYVPAFLDYANLTEGDPISLELTLTEHETTVTGGGLGDPDVTVMARGPVVASFYGRATDLKARPLIDRPGVSIDVVAIDYTADLLEAPEAYVSPFDGTVISEAGIVQNAMKCANGGSAEPLNFIGSLPQSGGLAPDCWTSATNDQVPGFGYAQPGKAIDDMLRQAVNNPAGTRMIVAPLLDAAGHLVNRYPYAPFTLDTVHNGWAGEYTSTADAHSVDADVTWTQVKGEAPTSVTVTYNNNATPATIGSGRVDQPVSTTMPQDAFARAAAVAAFYYRDPSADQPWQPDEVTWYLHALDEAELTAFPTDLFPHLKAAEGSPERVACYRHGVLLHDVDPSVCPYDQAGHTGLAALLGGVTVELLDGLASMTLNLRYPRLV